MGALREQPPRNCKRKLDDGTMPSSSSEQRAALSTSSHIVQQVTAIIEPGVGPPRQRSAQYTPRTVSRKRLPSNNSPGAAVAVISKKSRKAAISPTAQPAAQVFPSRLSIPPPTVVGKTAESGQSSQKKSFKLKLKAPKRITPLFSFPYSPSPSTTTSLPAPAAAPSAASPILSASAPSPAVLRAHNPNVFRFLDLPLELRQQVYDQVFYDERHALRKRVGASYASSEASDYSRGDPFTAVIKVLDKGPEFRVMHDAEPGILRVNQKISGEYQQQIKLVIFRDDTEFFCPVSNFNFAPVLNFLGDLKSRHIQHINSGRAKHANFTLILGFHDISAPSTGPVQMFEWSKWAVRKKWTDWLHDKGRLHLENWIGSRKEEQDKTPREVVFVSPLPEDLVVEYDDQGDLNELIEDWARQRHMISPKTDDIEHRIHMHHNKALVPYDGYVEVDYAIDLDAEPPCWPSLEPVIAGCDDSDIKGAFKQWKSVASSTIEEASLFGNSSYSTKLSSYAQSGRAVVDRSRDIALFRLRGASKNS